MLALAAVWLLPVVAWAAGGGKPATKIFNVADTRAIEPGRKAALYFTGGLTVPSQIDHVYRATISEASRAGVSFYAVDVAGLGTWSEAQSARDALEDVARVSREQSGDTSGAVSVGEVELTDRTVDSTRGNWKQLLRELSDSTGGFATVDTNDYKKPMERLAGDLGGHYEVAYASASAARSCSRVRGSSMISDGMAVRPGTAGEGR